MAARDDLIKAGDLRHRIAFLERRVAVESGRTLERYVEAFTCWAAVKTMSSRTYYQAAAINREDEIRFVIRYRPDVREDMRIVYGGKEYVFDPPIDPGERHVRLELVARRLKKEGEKAGV